MLGKAGAFHSVFQSRQHALRPDRRFGPLPAGADLSDWHSSCGHSHRFAFRLSVRHASAFLRPFAPYPLRHFIATVGPLTPARLSIAGRVSLLHVHGLPTCLPPGRPPRLAVAQLQLVTGRRAHTWRRFSPLRPCTLAGALGAVREPPLLQPLKGRNPGHL